MKPRTIAVAPSDSDWDRLDEIAAATGDTHYRVHQTALRIGLLLLSSDPEAYTAYAVRAAAEGRGRGRPPTKA